MDPALALLTSNPLLAAGGWGLSILLGIYIVTGFTVRGWRTTKQQKDITEQTTLLLTERRATADSALAANFQLASTVTRQQQTISEMDQFFRKIPVNTPRQGGNVAGADAQQPEKV